MSIFRFGIAARLGLGFGFMLVLMSALTWVAVDQVNTLNANLAQINEINSVKQRYAINFRGSVHDRAIAIRDVTALPARERGSAISLIDTLAADYARNEQAMTEMIEGPAGATAEERRILAEIADIQARTNPLVAQIINLQNAGDTTAAASRLAEVRPLFDAWLAAINEFIDFHEAVNQQIGGEVHEAASSFQMLALWSLAVAILLALVAAALVSRSITAPLGRLSAVMRSMAGGVFTAEVPHVGRRDEVGDMAATVEVFRQNGIKVAEMTAAEAGRISAALDAKGQIEAASKSQAVVEFDVDGRIISANENFCGAMGYQFEEIKGRHHRMFVDPGYADSSEYRNFWAELARGEAKVAEFQMLGKGGKEVWIQASYNPIVDASGKVYKVVNFATDITGRIHAVREIGAGLSRMSEGDLACEINAPFIPSLDQLRQDFNNSVETLRATLKAVGRNAGSIDAAAGEVRSAADDLSRRTEQQAASVEETAAALEQMTATVKSSAQRAEEAGGLVKRTRSSAEKSETVVRQAIATMQEIERSSQEIGSIIGVIDEIAFQTNLLALNAGVEAARAGDAGRGFAVVASEVRDLAQRSAEAAQQIKKLITKSGGEVKSGVALVGDTGEALQAIIGDVKEISDHVIAIVEASREQATGLAEINSAVGMIDEGTQQNAAMVEETSAASHSLADEAARLNELLSRFQLGTAMATASRSRQPAKQVTKGSVRRSSGHTGARIALVQGATALAQRLHDEQDADWEEF
ncbi:MAG: methyl-accepting chemotaxis protein [Aliihoeflea sp.]